MFRYIKVPLGVPFMYIKISLGVPYIHKDTLLPFRRIEDTAA